ncbi:MAG: hypothetical protein IJV02_05375 [Candidatus Methanomethylophilaceae archaeon]|nr:hypothetical protein [Candidatus Methanomethylophilaceae archaeon]
MTVKGYSLGRDLAEIYEKDGEKRIHILSCCWENDGRKNDDGKDAPYTVTDYTGCDFPVASLIAAADRRGYWDTAVSEVKQYECDLTEEEFIALGYDGDEDEYKYILLRNISNDSPCGTYLVIL